MKKIIIAILFVLLCQLSMMAQEQEVSKATLKQINRAEKAINKIQEPEDYQKVINKLLVAIEKSPNHPIIIYDLGICYDGMGIIDENNYYKAIEYYKLFLALNPNEKDIENVIDRMQEIASIIINSTADVYVAGYEEKSNGKAIATLWKNGKAIQLSNNDSNDACAETISAKGNIIYIGGYERSNANLISTLWKNGDVVPLSSGKHESICKSTFVYDNSIYAVGHDGCNIALWKDGIKQNFLNNIGSAYAIHISDGDIYIAGHNANRFAVLWKNGYLQKLAAAHDKISNSVATAIYISGNDVYVAGYENVLPIDANQFENNKAILWKNGIPQVLPTEEGEYKEYYSGIEANSVFASDGNVYVAGVGKNREGENVAVLWKNGKPKYLSDVRSKAYSVYVLGNFVYVAGYVINDYGKRTAVIWKNGRIQRLNTEYPESAALSIYVK